MLKAPATANTVTDIQALVSNKTEEGRELDYKRDLNLGTDGEKKEFIRDICSLANAAGGSLPFRGSGMGALRSPMRSDSVKNGPTEGRFWKNQGY
jgi:hypothetical protein